MISLPPSEIPLLLFNNPPFGVLLTFWRLAYVPPFPGGPPCSSTKRLNGLPLFCAVLLLPFEWMPFSGVFLGLDPPFLLSPFDVLSRFAHIIFGVFIVFIPSPPPYPFSKVVGFFSPLAPVPHQLGSPFCSFSLDFPT